MNVLDIIPIHRDWRNCTEDTIVSVASWLQRNHELMYAESWGFAFDIRQWSSTGKLSTSLSPDSGNMFPLLAQYHGIDIRIVENLSFQDTAGVIARELAESRPVIVELDTYECPWDSGYHSYHYPHTNLIVGYDEANRMYSLIDCFYQKQSIKLSSESCFSYDSNRNRVAVFQCSTLPEPVADWRTIIRHAARRIRGPEQTDHSFHQMRSLAAILEQSPDLNEEFKQHKHIWMAPLLSVLNAISNGRRQFAAVLQYLNTRQQEQDFHETVDELYYAASQWSILLSMVTKSYYSPRDRSLLPRAADKLRMIADKEEHIAGQLLSMCEEKANGQQTMSKNIIVSPISDQADRQFVELAEYFNNKGFDRSLSEESKADLTLMGDYLLADDPPVEWKLEGMKFSLPVLNCNNYDNISCAAQSIRIPAGHYSAIALVGCSECGSYSDQIELVYEDRSASVLPIAFTDCYMEPLYGESIVWSGRAASRKNGQNQLNESQAHVFTQNYALDTTRKMVGMRLPDCPNLHIFAMALYA
ncbi:BtrH N-terminal domain-containing protein [Paenibacillus graminis]|uniref:BtrH N-terminal domain-containing protein n=1 Tax=Paenibacillus graminis TaxID=189425 RepID=UPI002DBA4A7B|nr:BtrH N-terminal domain-containing protein [Paenibacillus graminis]MEC0168785.1 BtrH N-terminal domain-containing protein [Paenibacillus graminis]